MHFAVCAGNWRGSRNPWQDLLLQILTDWQCETGDGEVPNRQTLEFLYETLAAQRQDRRLGKGVFLSTIHSAKGMEFPHVLILDGGWSPNKLEEQRRLFYVAMTRAKETLCLMHRNDVRNPFLAAMDGDFLLRRNAETFEQPAPQTVTRRYAVWRYAVLGMQDIDIGYAGSFAISHAIHQHLAALNFGSRLAIEQNGDKVFLKYNDSNIAALSQKAVVQWRDRLDTVESITVLAMSVAIRTMARKAIGAAVKSASGKCQWRNWC